MKTRIGITSYGAYIQILLLKEEIARAQQKIMQV